MRAVLLDLDETLLDRKSSLAQFSKWQASERLKLDDIDSYVDRFLDLDANGSVWKDVVYETLRHEFLIECSADALISEYILHFSKFCIERPGAVKSVSQLAERGFKLGLVSNGKSPFQENNFYALGIENLFGTVVVSDAVGYRKPDPEIFQIACRALSVIPRECVFVGDNPETDIMGASKLGMYTVFVPSLYFGETCNHADAICSDFKELVSIVESAC